jgi:predicted aldo/keto reductase-like oxidoreductase
MGRALRDVREDVYLATKVHEAEPEAIRRSVETSLEELQTDYLDCMQIHSPVIQRVGFDTSLKILDELENLRARGLFRFIGLSTHVLFETVYRLIDTGRFDQVLLARGYMRRGMDTMLSNQNVEWSEKCVARARELGMGIVAMKVMGLNMLGRGSTLVVPDYDPERRRRLPGAAIRWALQDERTSVVIIGMSVPDDVSKNVATVRGDLTLSEEDRMLLADYAVRAHQSNYVKRMAVV